MKPERGPLQPQEKRRKAGRPRDSDTPAPDPRLVDLVRLLARHAARQDHEQALRDAQNSGNPEDSSAGNKP